MAMLRKLNMFEYTFDRKKAYLESKGIKADELSEENIESEFLRLSKEQKARDNIIKKQTEEKMTKNEIKADKSFREVLKELGTQKTKIFWVEGKRVQVSVTGSPKSNIKTNGKTNGKK